MCGLTQVNQTQEVDVAKNLKSRCRTSACHCCVVDVGEPRLTSITQTFDPVIIMIVT